MLYKNMINFYNKKSVNPHQNIPKTYHLTCFNWQEVIKEVRAEENKWILKPGEFTNRGKMPLSQETIFSQNYRTPQ